ncbi:MAG: hypothetical protein NVS3B18_11060 [Candidatus Dormibacteria bacterium]
MAKGVKQLGAPHQWLLVSVSTSGAAPSVRVQVWRKLRSLGALYLQPSVCLLPDIRAVRADVDRLLRRVELEGGTTRCLAMSLADRADEARVLGEFRDAVDLEYREVLEGTPDFLDELSRERAKGRLTYAEVEESEHDLERFQRWLARIERRDYFDGALRDEARSAVARCSDELEAFTLAALAAQSGESLTTSAARLSVVRGTP